MSDSGFDTPRPKDPKLSFQAWMSGLAALALLTACQIEARFLKSPTPASTPTPGPTATETATPTPPETPTPTTTPMLDIDALRTIESHAYATVTAEANEGQQIENLSPKILDSAVDLDSCSGTVVELKKINDNLSQATIFTGSHCVFDRKTQTNLTPQFKELRQPHKNDRVLSILDATSRFTLVTEGSDFGVLVVVLDGDTRDIVPIGYESISPGVASIQPGEVLHGLGFPGGYHGGHPLVAEVAKVDPTGTVHTNIPSAWGDSGAGIFYHDQLSYISVRRYYDYWGGFDSGYVPIPQNFKEMTDEAVQELLVNIENNSSKKIDPETAIKTLYEHLSPSLMEATCTTVKPSGEIGYFQYTTIPLIPNSHVRNDAAYMLDIQQCIKNGWWDTVTIRDPKDTQFWYDAEHSSGDEQACVFDQMCALTDPDQKLKDAFPPIPMSRFGQNLLLDGPMFAQDIFGNFIQIFPKTGLDGKRVFNEHIKPGSPLVRFKKDGNWEVFGMNIGYGGGYQLFTSSFEESINNAIQTINKNLVHAAEYKTTNP